MKIVVIGDGKIGFTLTQALVAEGHDLVVIDNQKEPLDKTETALDVQILEGNDDSCELRLNYDDVKYKASSAERIMDLYCGSIKRILSA